MAVNTDDGRSASPSGHPSETEPCCTVSAQSVGVPNADLTCFGVALDRLARTVGAWPSSAVVHTMEVLRGGNTNEVNPQVLLEGHIPTGEKSGHATFKGCARELSFKAVVRLSEYRAAIATETRRAETTGSVEDEGAVAQPIAQTLPPEQSA